MGQEIFYCAKCAIRILSSDIEKGKAFRIGNQTVCKDCAPEVAPGLSTEELQLASRKTPPGGTPLPAPPSREPLSSFTPRSMPRVGGTPAPTATRRAVVEAAPPRSRKPLVLGLIGGGIVLLLVVIVLALSGEPSKSPPRVEVPPPTRPPEKAEDANTRTARLACEKAFKHMKERPGDLDGQIALYEEAVRAAQGTEYFEQARAARDALLNRRLSDVPREMAQLSEQARPLVEKEDFKAVLELYGQARKKREAPDWVALIDGKIQEVLKSIEQSLESIKERAAEDRRSGAAEGVRKARERVGRWGLPDRSAALDAFLAEISEARMPVQGLAGWWKMDEGAGTTLEDASGRGHGGTLGGSAAWEKGRQGKALSFDGRQAHVRIHPFFESIRNTFTIALWAFPRATLLITREGNTGGPELKGHRFAIFPTHGKHFGAGHAGVGLSIGTNGISVFEHADAHLPSPLVYASAVRGWTHVAVVYADREPVLYVDGQRAKAGMKSTREVHPSCELGGGASSYGSYDGLLDDVRIYDRALSEAEVRALALTGERPWRAIFDGKTNACLRGSSRDGWIVDRGALTKSGPPNAAQTSEEFGDGEVRVRFEVEDMEVLRFYIRQGDDGKHYAELKGAPLKALEGKSHEIVFLCKGASVTAALDGSDLSLVAEGNSRRGCLQFNGTGRVIRILSIEFRDAK
jgi:hypothetical protein